MAESNVDIIRATFGVLDGVNVAEIDWTSEAIRDALGAAYSSDVELTTLASGIGTGIDERFRGLDELSRYLHEWLEPFSEYYVENLDYIPVGTCVLVPSSQRGVGAGSGARVELELTTLYELRDGLIIRLHQYDTLDEARADAESTG